MPLTRSCAVQAEHAEESGKVGREQFPLPKRGPMVKSRRMLTDYLRTAMGKAHYELLGGGEGFYAEIPGFDGVLAQADTLEACREELASTLEDWLLFRVSRHLPIPVLQGLDLTVKEVGNPA
jgi:predicted RNase H-like HicB family nuclease